VRTGASGRNWASYGADITAPDSLEPWRIDLLCDPQTSGGLLIAADPAGAEALIASARACGFSQTAVVGRLLAGPARLILQT
jgi:selenide,water dikinase